MASKKGINRQSHDQINFRLGPSRMAKRIHMFSTLIGEDEFKPHLPEILSPEVDDLLRSLSKGSVYPLVNVYIAIEHHHF